MDYKNNHKFILCLFLANTLVFWVIGYQYLYSILANTALFKNSVVVSSPTIFHKLFVLFFSVSNFLTYMMFLCLAPTSILLIINFFTKKRTIVIFSSIVVFSFSIILLLTDAQVYAMFKFHLNKSVISFIASPYSHEILDLSGLEICIIFGSIILIFTLETLLAKLIWNKTVKKDRIVWLPPVLIGLLGGFLFCIFTLLITINSHNNLFSQQISNLPLYRQFLATILPDENTNDMLVRFTEQYFSQPLFPEAKLKYPLQAMNCSLPKENYNVILITVDSLRYDMLNSKFMPNLTKFSQKTWNFTQHYSGGNGTQPGLFSLFYSLPSNYWSSFLKQNRTPILIDVLLQNNYLTRIIWSMKMYKPPFDKTVYYRIPNLQINGGTGLNSGDWDRDTTQKAITFLENRNDKPFYLHLFYNAPHAYCGTQNFPTPFQPISKYCIRVGSINSNEENFNRYLNTVFFIDNEIGKILNTIAQKQYLANSIIIFTADHGQEFNDNKQNYWNHGSNFSDAQTRVPFLVYWPKQRPQVFSHVTSHYDLVPTILQRLFNCKNDTVNYSIGKDLLNKEKKLPFLLVGSYINMGIIESDRITVLERSGRVSISDRNVKNLADAQPRDHIVNEALYIMRRYFQK